MSTPGSTPATGGEGALFARPSFADLYEQALVGPLFRPWVDALLDEVQLGPGDRVVDVACGTGIVARVAGQRLGSSARVVGIDASPQMLAVARRLAPSIDWREGSASALPLPDGERFDVLVCQQGFQFFPDRVTAATQMRRALMPGGRLGMSVWLSDETLPLLRQLRAVAERYLGPVDDRRHSVPDALAIASVLRDAGFHDVRATRATRRITFDDGATFVRLNAMALLGMSATARTSSGDERQRLVADIVRDSDGLIRSHTDLTGFGFDMATHVLLARA